MPLPSLPPVPVIGKTIPTTWGGLARAFMEALGKGENWIVGDQPTQPDAAGAPNSFQCANAYKTGKLIVVVNRQQLYPDEFTEVDPASGTFDLNSAWLAARGNNDFDNTADRIQCHYITE